MPTLAPAPPQRKIPPPPLNLTREALKAAGPGIEALVVAVLAYRRLIDEALEKDGEGE